MPSPRKYFRVLKPLGTHSLGVTSVSSQSLASSGLEVGTKDRESLYFGVPRFTDPAPGSWVPARPYRGSRWRSVLPP